MYKADCIILKSHNPLIPVLDEQTGLAKLFKNACIFRLRQLCFAWRKDYVEENLSDLTKEVLKEFKDAGINITHEHSIPTYYEFDKMFKITKNPDYYNDIPMQSTQQIIKECLQDFDSYFAAVRSYNQNPEKFAGRPKIPKYCKNDHISFDITNQDAKVYEYKETSKENGLSITKYELKLPKTKIRLNLGTLEIKHLKEVTVTPYYNTYKISIKHEIEIPEAIMELKKKLNPARIIAFDLGVDNFLASSNNCGLTPFVVNGKVMKSKNQYINERIAELASLLPEGITTSKKIQSLWQYRDSYFDNEIKTDSKPYHTVLYG